MQSAVECLCCQETEAILKKCNEQDPPITCILEHKSFEAACLNTDVLDIAYYQYRQQYHGKDDHGKRTDEYG